MAKTDKLRQSQLELQAGQSGESAKQRAHEGLVASRHRTQERAERARQFDESVEQRNLDRWQRQWEGRRQDRARRERELAERQAEKPRTTMFGTEGTLDRGPEQSDLDKQLASRERMAAADRAQRAQEFETTTDLRAASAGLMRGGGAAAPQQGQQAQQLLDQAIQQNPDDPRLQKLREEMERGRRQMGAGIEQTGRRGFVPTPEERDKSMRQKELAERDMRTKEMNAAANLQRARTAYEKLGVQVMGAKSKEAKKELEAKQKEVEKSLEQPIRSDAARLNRFMRGEQTQADMQTLQAMLKDVPPVGMSRAIHDEANEGVVGPAVTRFLGEKVAASAIQFIYATGKLPDGKLVDFSSAGMQEFSKRAMEARQLLLPNTVAGKMLTEQQVGKVKRGYTDHLAIVNKLAALLVLKEQPTGPSAALGAEQEPTHEQRRADPTKPLTPAERQGQITPEEAARRAGQTFDRSQLPTTKPYEPPPERTGAAEREPDPFGRW